MSLLLLYTIFLAFKTTFNFYNNIMLNNKLCYVILILYKIYVYVQIKP